MNRPAMSKGWTEKAKFKLSPEELEKVFLLGGEKITVNHGYAETIAAALSKEIPGRFTSFSKPSVNKKSIVFRFVKPCAASEGCAKKWKIVCQTEPVINEQNDFIVSTNDIDCSHIQPPLPRPLTGTYLHCLSLVPWFTMIYFMEQVR